MSQADVFIWKSGKPFEGPGSINWNLVHVLYADGGIIAESGKASGRAAIGVVLKKPPGTLMDVVSRLIGWSQDHHIAEYRALIEGLRLARGHKIKRIQVRLDSLLVVRQLGGTARVRRPHLTSLHAEAMSVIGEFSLIKISHVPRRENVEADALANRALGR